MTTLDIMYNRSCTIVFNVLHSVGKKIREQTKCVYQDIRIESRMVLFNSLLFLIAVKYVDSLKKCYYIVRKRNQLHIN